MKRSIAFLTLLALLLSPANARLVTTLPQALTPDAARPDSAGLSQARAASSTRGMTGPSSLAGEDSIQAQPIVWQIEVVDDAGDVGQFSSIALDAEDRPHVSYYNAADLNLKYAYRDGTSWLPQTADDSGSVGSYTSLALDAVGRPHVSYLAASTVKYAWHDGTQWISETVDSGPVLSFSSLALDTSGDAHICWQQGAMTHHAGILRYAHQTGSTWVSQTVDLDGIVGAFPSLALDAADRPHISYYDETHTALKYAYHNGSAWVTQTVDSAGQVGSYTSLALDAAGRPHISYYRDDIADDLMYASYNGSTWVTETVDSVGSVGTHTSLALDAAGHPHISYYDARSTVLKYAYHDDSSWVTQTVDSAVGVGTYSSLALDAAGRPHISYYDEANHRLKYATPDVTPPRILSGSTVSPIAQHSATVTWTTDEGSDSVVRYGQRAGVYDATASDAALVADHVLTLDGLTPSTLYHYLVESTDAAGNTATSREGFFRTLPADDGERPKVGSLAIERGDTGLGYYRIGASAADNTAVDRVAFYVDETLIGTDYGDGGPSDGGPPGESSFQFAWLPASLGMSFETFSQTHTFRAQAYDRGGLSSVVQQAGVPPVGPLNGELFILTPDPAQKVYLDDGTLPGGTVMPITVYASEYEWECQWGFMQPATQVPREGPIVGPVGVSDQAPAGGDTWASVGDMIGAQQPPWCHDVERAVEHVEVHIDDALYAYITPDDENDLHHTYYWNMSHYWNMGTLGPGAHKISVHSFLHDETEGTRVRWIEILPGEPSVDVHREVSRAGHYFRVRLAVENDGTASLDLHVIVDNVTGFQVIGRETLTETLTPFYSSTTRRCDVEISLANDVPLAPGERYTVTYEMVPILYPDPWAGQYAVGAEQVYVLYVDNMSLVEERLDRPTHTTTQGELNPVWASHQAADYLIVTNPAYWFYLHNVYQVNELLSTMAELARLKQGILGYITTPYGQSAETTRDVIRLWGIPMLGSDGIAGHWLSNGYLLLVGEAEILGTWWSHHQQGAVERTVHWTDLPYANTAGSWKYPELMVGRIIGDTPQELMASLQTSIDVHNGMPGHTFERDQALAIAGRGSGVGQFEDNVDDIAAHLDDEFTVTKLKQRSVESAGYNMKQVFLSSVPDMDVVFYRDHCGTTSWGDGSVTVDTGDFPFNLGDSRPFVFACCCLAGRYESVGTGGIAEKFTEHGTGVYISATEISMRDKNDEACEWFYDHWVNSSNSLAWVFRQLKRSISGFESTYWKSEYHMYGDVKYDVYPLALTAVPTAQLAEVPAATQAFGVPPYEVSTVEGQDYVEIPGGDVLHESGRPLIPIYPVQVTYPQGQRVSDVTLTTRSGLTVTTGLSIPTHTVEWDAGSGDLSPQADGQGWWPESAFDWQVIENADGSSTLALALYPFYYNPATTDVKFYTNYEFEVQTISSTVDIEQLTTDAATYAPGDEVQIGLWLRKDGAAQDVLLEAVIQAEGDGQVVGGLPLRALEDLSGLATASMAWDSAGVEDGAYEVQVNVRDQEGNVLDSERVRFTLGIRAGEITSFSATPRTFHPGESVEVSLTFSNTGSTEILTGTATIQVREQGGGIVAQFDHDLQGLAPGAHLSFQDAWYTAPAGEGVYEIAGYVVYDGQATPPQRLTVQSWQRVYMPAVLRGFAP